MSGAVAQPGPQPTQAVTIEQPRPAGYMADLGQAGEGCVALLAIAGAAALIQKLLTREIKRDVADANREVADVRRDLDALAGDVGTLKTQRGDGVQRIVRLEATVAGIDQTVRRIEVMIPERLDRLGDKIDEIARAPR